MESGRCWDVGGRCPGVVAEMMQREEQKLGTPTRNAFGQLSATDRGAGLRTLVERLLSLLLSPTPAYCILHSHFLTFVCADPRVRTTPTVAVQCHDAVHTLSISSTPPQLASALIYHLFVSCPYLDRPTRSFAPFGVCSCLFIFRFCDSPISEIYHRPLWTPTTSCEPHGSHTTTGIETSHWLHGCVAIRSYQPSNIYSA